MVFDKPVTQIPASVFSGKTVLTSITLPTTITKIGNNAFKDCSNLTGALEIPETVETIGEYAFSATAITSLKLNEGLTTIGKSAFQNLSKVTGQLEIPASVKSIGTFAFLRSEALANSNGFTSLKLNEGLETIGQSAFIRNQKLNGTLSIPNSVTVIEQSAFNNCTGLDKLELGTGMDESNLETIGANAFKNCSALSGNLSIPNNVRTIGDYAFSNCLGYSRNSTLKLGKNITTIGDLAFTYTADISGLVDLLSSVPEIQTALNKLVISIPIGFSSIECLASAPPKVEYEKVSVANQNDTFKLNLGFTTVTRTGKFTINYLSKSSFGLPLDYTSLASQVISSMLSGTITLDLTSKKNENLVLSNDIKSNYQGSHTNAANWKNTFKIQ